MLKWRQRSHATQLPSTPRVAGLSFAVYLYGVAVLFAILCVNIVSVFIHPSTSFADSRVAISGDSSNALSYYCNHLAVLSLRAGSVWPGICQAPDALASSLVSSSPTRVTYTGDHYAYGNCTYWVALRRMQVGQPIPNTWGNAYSWSGRARSDGFVVDHTPAQGAIMQTAAGGLGHVAFVEGVTADGSWRISEMNVVGFNRVDYRVMPAALASSYQFIH